MASYQLPSIYLGSNDTARDAQSVVMSRYNANKDRFQSLNKFLAHLVRYALDNDQTLGK